MTDIKMNAITDEALGEVIGGVTRTVQNDSCGYANVRHEPGLSGTVAARLENGTKVKTTGETVRKDGYVWYKVTLESGSDEAWIA